MRFARFRSRAGSRRWHASASGARSGAAYASTAQMPRPHGGIHLPLQAPSEKLRQRDGATSRPRSGGRRTISSVRIRIELAPRAGAAISQRTHAPRRQDRDHLRHWARPRHRARDSSPRPRGRRSASSRRGRLPSSTMPRRRFARAGSRPPIRKVPTDVSDARAVRPSRGGGGRGVRAHRRARQQRLRAAAGSSRWRAADLDDWRDDPRRESLRHHAAHAGRDPRDEASGRRRDRHDQQHGDTEARGRIRRLRVSRSRRSRPRRRSSRSSSARTDPRELGVHGLDVGTAGRELPERGREAEGTTVEALAAGIAKSIPLGRIPDDAECAKAALFLVSGLRGRRDRRGARRERRRVPAAADEGALRSWQVAWRTRWRS